MLVTQRSPSTMIVTAPSKAEARTICALPSMAAEYVSVLPSDDQVGPGVAAGGTSKTAPRSNASVSKRASPPCAGTSQRWLIGSPDSGVCCSLPKQAIHPPSGDQDGEIGRAHV